MTLFGDRKEGDDAPRVYTLPPEADFLAAVAETLRDSLGADQDPAALARALILTPTRRAARALGEAFAEAGGGGAAILPMIRPLGDVDVDEPPFEPGELAAEAPPAISPARRKFELARLVLAKEEALERPIGVAGALALADPLAVLLDDLANESAGDLKKIEAEILDLIPADRREAAEFLSIVLEIWPARLAELGVADPAARRASVLRALCRRWTEAPPDHPVIVAGSTGSIEAARDLIAVVARLPQGAVILPGLDKDGDEAAWEAVDDPHPQWAMKALLDEIGIDRRDVRDWPGGSESAQGRARRIMLGEALRPAEQTSGWLDRIRVLRAANGDDFFDKALAGLAVVEAPDSGAEARAAALMLLDTLQSPGRTALLVTPDRALARRVCVEMGRFGVVLDDSSGQSLALSPTGRLLTAILEAALDPGSATALKALTASPLAAFGQDRAELRRRMHRLDRRSLRGVRPGRNWRDLADRIGGRSGSESDPDAQWALALIADLETLFLPLAEAGRRSPADWARGHAAIAERIASEPDRPGAERVWATDSGDAGAALIRDLINESDALPDMTLAEYANAFDSLARARNVRPRFGAHPRLQVLGPLEARLQTADRVILAGLNEGVWPAAIGQDPFLSRGMRAAAGLGAPEQRFGLAAHDFAQLAGGRDVIMTRSEKVDGAPATASRWLWRLRALARGALGEDGADQALKPASDWVGWAEALDHADPAASVAEPRPAPLERRPTVMSVSDVRNWIRDPYSIYAKHVLGLRKLDPADMPPGPRERGNALHDALEAFLKAHRRGALPENAQAELVRIGAEHLAEKGFAAEEIEVETRRLARAVGFLLEWEAKRREDGYEILSLEEAAEWRIERPGAELRLTARADRIDRRPDGRLDVIDYKTGDAPTKKATQAGFEPQLPLVAAMAGAGEFKQAGPGDAAQLTYLKLGGGAEAGRDAGFAADELAAQYTEILEKLIDAYADPDQPYLSQPRAQYVNKYGDFDHLARRTEWAAAGEDGEGET